MATGQLTLRQLTPAIGAEVSNVNLAEPITETLSNAIYDALIEHQVLFFRDQAITPENHLAFARSFGEPQPPHPVYPSVDGFENVIQLKNGPDNPPDTDGWHTDLTFQQQPPFASILWAKQVPACGGDTLYLSLASAYERLPEGVRSELRDMSAVHDLGDFRNTFARNQTDGAAITSAHEKFGSAIHPVVQTHPVSGRRFLFVNEGFTQHLIGLKATDSNKLLDYLYHHISQPENQVRFQWTTHAMAIWDNRCTSHYATADYLPEQRIMHRITVVNNARVNDC